MLHAIYLGLASFSLWLLLSGYFEIFLLSLGLLSTCLVVYIARRMDVADHEGRSLHMHVFRLFGYWAWLGMEIVKANLDVTRRILDPRLPISPEVFWSPVTQGSEVGRVAYANSITLTPGTVAIDLEGDEVEVHALNREAADGVRSGEMDRKVTALDL